MDPTTTIEKLRVLLPHWIEHNRNHEAEFRKWSAAARAEGSEGLAMLLDRAAANMAATDEILKEAQSEAGCSPDDGHAPHAHPHRHPH
jgi:hypothetical protein